MDKKDKKQIQQEITERLQKLRNNGWEPIKCDDYNKEHFLRLGGNDLYVKDDGILCRNCIFIEGKGN